MTYVVKKKDLNRGEDRIPLILVQPLCASFPNGRS
jgi:hypothetical protein